MEDGVMDTAQPENAEAAFVDWKNPPKLTDLKQDLAEAKTHHDNEVGRIDGYLDNLHITGKAKLTFPRNSSKVQPKLIRKQAEWRYAALSEPFLSTDDVFNVYPVSWEDKGAAIQNQLVLNHQFNTRLNKTKFIDEYVRTAVDEGTVIVRVGWAFEEEVVEEEQPVWDYRINPAMASQYEELTALAQQDPDRYAQEVHPNIQKAHQLSLRQGVPIEAVQTSTQMVEVVKVAKNQPTLEICDFHNVLIDPTCKGDLDEANFVIFRFESSLAKLQKDGRYKNLDKIVPSAYNVLGEPDHAVGDENSKTFTFQDKPRQKIVVHEYWGYWDIDGTGLLRPFVAAWIGDTLVRLEANPFPDKKLPFVIVQYLPKRKHIYGEPDGALLEDNQQIIGAVTRGMIDIMGKSANGQTGIRKDMLDLTNKRKFEGGQDYEFNANVDPRQGIFMHTYPEIPMSAQVMLQLQNQEAESLTGVKAFSSGISSQSLGDVAAGIRGALDASSKRELGILRRLSDGIVKIGRKIIAMNAEFLSEEEVVRITNEEFVTIRRDDLPGNFDLKLSISTAEEDNNKAQELAFMLQTMGNNMDPAMSRMILADIARLRKMPDLAKRIETYQPQPDPMQQKLAELEIALKEAQLQETLARAASYETGANLNQARVVTEAARAEDIQNAADLKNLDFVEQETGTKQARDLQKQGAQARAQGQLALLQHELDLRLEKNKPKASK